MYKAPNASNKPPNFFRIQKLRISRFFLGSAIAFSSLAVILPVYLPSALPAAHATTFNVNDFRVTGSYAKECSVTTCVGTYPITYATSSPLASNTAGTVELTTTSPGNQGGFAWSRDRMDLRSNFDINAEIFLGKNDGGADGIAFVLQTVSTASGTTGGGLGYQGLNDGSTNSDGSYAKPCFAVEFDTYYNGGYPYGDLGADHVGLMDCIKDNILKHNMFTPASGAVGVANIEDGLWHRVRFVWTAPATPTGAGILEVWFDQNGNGTYEAGDKLFNTSLNLYNLFTNQVNGVFWGFTAATGGASNYQAVRGLVYTVVPRSNTAPVVTVAPTSPASAAGAGYTAVTTLSDDATTQSQWQFATTTDNPSRVTALSTAATSATSATTTFTLAGSSGQATIFITATDADGATVQTSFVISPARAALTAFSFVGLSPPVIGSINESAHTVTLTVPYGTDRNGLIPTFTLASGATAKIGATSQTSGVTSNNFSSALTYRVTGSDATYQDYVVTTNLDTLARNAKVLSAFSLDGGYVATIDQTAKTVALMLPYGSAVGSRIATFTLSSGATATIGAVSQISADSPNAFTNPVTYRITALDGTYQDYVVTVTVPTLAQTYKVLSAFSFAGLSPTVTGTINESAKTIALTVPYGTSLTSLPATFTVSDSATATVSGVAQVSGTTTNNFSSDVTYRVTAFDQSTQDYRVTVTTAANPAKAITAFSFAGLSPTVTGTINESAKTIALTVPYGTSVTSLVSTFTTTGASV
ncbi:MAG: hypothetical protein F2845_07165, partial [Actinobacteria bacterium]|nr:hypothetical protein [Actinomycetota bacterium]MSZ75441.1 hypothetical protein [Actinomycetota bacterium]MTA62660.1 hypothetical protein [Actinomycetota bacterium]